MLCQKPIEIFNNNIARERIDKRFKEFCSIGIVENPDYLKMKRNNER